jgi:uncharacterized protein (DUF58 family)
MPAIQPDLTALAKIRSLELRARIIVEGLWRGLHRSSRQGFSVEFAEYRPYTKGDDLRFMDWKVAARSDRYFIKKFEEETHLPCQLLLDMSRSMNYGSRPDWSKANYAATLAATLSLFLLKQGDAVGLSTFSDHLLQHHPSSAGPKHFQRLLTALETPATSSSTSLASSLDQISSLLRKRGLVVLISDLLTPTDQLRQQLSWVTTRRHELVVLHVADAQELDFRFDSAAHFVDAEGGSTLFINPAAQRQSYLTKLEAHLAAISAACDQTGARYLLARTDQPIGDLLAKMIQA